MNYRFGDKVIIIETDYIRDGKKPGLYIGNEYCVERVARFTNKDDALAFAYHLRAILEQYDIVEKEATE